MQLATASAPLNSNLTPPDLVLKGLDAFQGGRFREAVDCAKEFTEAQRSRFEGRESAWRGAVETLRKSPLFSLMQRCPMSAHSFQRPRGYPGDALLLDWLYRDFRINPMPEASSHASRILRHTTECVGATAVRWRRQCLANMIDEAADRVAKPRVLAVAAGHLREADLSLALKSGRVGELVALDQDASSLQEIERSYISQGMPITLVETKVKNVILGKADLGKFDLIYSAGLYDYLEADVAARLTRSLWDCLNPGGELLLTNFLTGLPERGYMESVMDWWLIYRTPEEIAQFSSNVPPTEIAHQHAFTCGTRKIGYMSLRRSNSSASNSTQQV